MFLRARTQPHSTPIARLQSEACAQEPGLLGRSQKEERVKDDVVDLRDGQMSGVWAAGPR